MCSLSETMSSTITVAEADGGKDRGGRTYFTRRGAWNPFQVQIYPVSNLGPILLVLHERTFNSFSSS